MFLKNNHWIYKKSLPLHLCNNIITFCLDKKNIEKGVVRGGLIDPIRDSYVVWNSERWIKNLIMNYIIDANEKANWNFNIEECENIQFTIYGKKQHYDWHSDSFENPYEMGKYKGLIRKISASILLNENFKEGDFLFNIRNGNDPNQEYKINEKTTGTVIVFPSHIRHKVTKVIEGTRYSLVCWSLGKPFR